MLKQEIAKEIQNIELPFTKLFLNMLKKTRQHKGQFTELSKADFKQVLLYLRETLATMGSENKIKHQDLTYLTQLIEKESFKKVGHSTGSAIVELAL
jgi:hypothetical protein